MRLYRQDGIVDSLLIDGIDGTVAIAPAVKLRVTKNVITLWSLFLDQPGTGNSYQLEGTSTESKCNTSSYFWVFCDYTSTRLDNFLLDDFIISGSTYALRVQNVEDVSGNPTLSSSKGFFYFVPVPAIDRDVVY